MKLLTEAMYQKGCRILHERWMVNYFYRCFLVGDEEQLQVCDFGDANNLQLMEQTEKDLRQQIPYTALKNLKELLITDVAFGAETAIEVLLHPFIDLPEIPWILWCEMLFEIPYTEIAWEEIELTF